MQRTPQQNRAMHKFFRQVAEALNDAGYHVNDRVVIRMDIPFTEEVVKEFMWKRIQGAMYPGKESTTELTTAEVGKVYEVFNRVLGDNWEISVPFPSEEE